MRTTPQTGNSMPNIQTLSAHMLASLFVFLVPLCVFAEADGDGGFVNPLGKDTTLYDFLYMILNSVVYIVFPFIVLMIVYTGFLFVSAQGNESKLTQARQSLVWTVVGALVVLGAKALALAIEATVADIAS